MKHLRCKTPTMRTRSKTGILVTLLASMFLVCSLALCACGEQGGSQNANNIDVTVTITSTADGDSFDATEPVSVPEGSNALEALQATGLDVQVKDGSFVTSISGIANGAHGDTSGWVYDVNGETIMVGANEYVVKAGDVINWVYYFE